MFLCVLDRNGARTAAPRDFCTRVSTPVYAQAHADAPRPPVSRASRVFSSLVRLDTRAGSGYGRALSRLARAPPRDRASAHGTRHRREFR